MFYTSVGSIEPPVNIRRLMVEISLILGERGWILRKSTNSIIEECFFTGAKNTHFYNASFIPVKSNVFCISTRLAEKAWNYRATKETLHSWSSLKTRTIQRLTFETLKLIGYDLKTPVDVIFTWSVTNKGDILHPSSIVDLIKKEGRVKQPAMINLFDVSSRERICSALRSRRLPI